MPDPEELLGRISIFESLTSKELRKLARDAHDVTFEAGRHLTDDDGFGTTFFVVVDGTLDVQVQGQSIRKLGPGDYFGEMAVISRDTRSATVVAETESRCLVFSRPVFRPFAARHPDVMWALLELMVKRVREAESRAAPARGPAL